jgi:hypothetical protein
MPRNTTTDRPEVVLLRDIRSLLERIATEDELPPYRPVPNAIQLALRRERAAEPAVRIDTVFKPLLVGGEQKMCDCHHKPMVYFMSGNTVKEICTVNAWWQIYHQAIRLGRWREIPQSPKELYRLSCNGKVKGG